MTREAHDAAGIDEQALAWFTRSRAPGFDAAGLEAWLDQDPAHRSAFDALAFTWQGIEPIADDPRIRALMDERLPAWRRTWTARALAACLAVAVLGGGTLAGLNYWPASDAFSNQQFRTGVGEKATVTLPDGSSVTLSTDTLVRTRKDGDRRLVYLERGQAFFDVAKDPRHPFVVHAAGRTVTALGTAFEVRVDDGFKVTLVEGKVRVAGPLAPRAPRRNAPSAAPPAQEIVMVAGAQLVAGAETWSIGRTDVRRETSWVRGQLVFVDEPLADVVAEMNRFSDRKMIVDDKAGATLISGTFKPGDVGAFVAAVEDYGLVAIASETPGQVRLAGLK